MPITAGFIVPHPPLIVPEVGKGQEKGIQATVDSYHEAARRIAELSPETIIVISPHSVMYSDYIHISPGERASGGLKQFGAGTVYDAEYDTALVGEIESLCDHYRFPAGTLGQRDKALDHGTVIPLHFINQYYTGYKLIRCSISGLTHLEHYRFGMILQESVVRMNRNVVVVASGDMSHKLKADGPYGYVPEGPELDGKMVEVMKSGDFGGFIRISDELAEKGAQCGLDSFIVMAGTLDCRAVTARFCSYEGPYGVGYGIAYFEDAGAAENRAFYDSEMKDILKNADLRRTEEDVRVRIARETLEAYVKTGKSAPPQKSVPDELLHTRAGVFVSIKKHGRLRGCIGTIEPATASVYEEIRQNAVSSGTRDPRFPAVAESELPELVYSVDVLSPAEPCGREELDVRRYGVIVTSGRRRGLLLPNLDGVDSVDEQLAIALQKAGIGESESYSLERFEVKRYT